MTRSRLALTVSILGALIASVPAAGIFSGSYEIDGYFVQTLTHKGDLVAMAGSDFHEAVRIDPDHVALLSPGPVADLTGSWAKKGGAYVVSFSKSFAPQIQASYAPATVKKVAYRLLDMHPFGDHVDGNVRITFKLKSGGLKLNSLAKGALFGTQT